MEGRQDEFRELADAFETMLARLEAQVAEQQRLAANAAPTKGSHALLLQMTTNLVQNAIVHNLAEEGAVWVTTGVDATSVELTVENTGETLTPQAISALPEPFQRGTERIRTNHAGVGLG